MAKIISIYNSEKDLNYIDASRINTCTQSVGLAHEGGLTAYHLKRPRILTGV